MVSETVSVDTESAVAGCGYRCLVLSGYRAVLELRCCVYAEGLAAGGGGYGEGRAVLDVDETILAVCIG